MQDKELYEKIMGIEKPWVVSDLKVDFGAMRVDVVVEYKSAKGECPECKGLCSIYDHRPERIWRHLDTMQFQTFVRSSTPRIECKEHGVVSVKISWAERNSRFTLLFERLAIDVLLACANQTKARSLLGLSWDEVHHIQEKAVQRGLARRRKDGPMEYLGADEKSFLRGHKYITILTDINDSSVLEVSEDRKDSSLGDMLKTLAPKQKESVKAVCVDMWEPYMKAIGENLPKADIVHDRFHIHKHLNEAVDKVRRRENRELIREGVSVLKKTKYLWLKNPSGWTNDEKSRFKELKTEGLRIGRAWAIREAFGKLWNYFTEGWARRFFKVWFFWATHSRMKPIIEVARMFKRHFERILTYVKHRITNAVSEGLNSRIQCIKASARGFRNFHNFRNSILFYCGKLELYPQCSL